MSVAIEKLKTAIENAGTILVGAGSGFSTAAGYTYSGERFLRHFADFIEKYHFLDMYSAGFYPFPTQEEKWAYNTPGIIKFPFWKMTAANPQATYACLNKGAAGSPDEIKGQSILVDDDIASVLQELIR